MFLGQALSGMGQGYKQQVKGQVDREQFESLKQQKQQRNEMFKLNKEKTENDIQLTKTNMVKTNLELDKIKMDRAIEISYDRINESFTEEDPEMASKLYSSSLVQNQFFNYKLANSEALNTNLGQLTSIKDNGDGTLTLRNDLKGIETVVDERLALGAIGFWTKQDEISALKAKKNYDTKMNALKLKKEQSEINKNVSITSKNFAEASEKNFKISKEQQTQNNYKKYVDLASDVNPNIANLNQASTEIKYNKEIMDNLNKDGKYNDTNTHLSLYDAAGDLQKEVNTLANGLMNDPIGTVEKFAANTVGYTLDDKKKEAIAKANTLSAKMRLLVMDYLQYKSGAAFGQVELEGYEKVGGIADFTDPDAAKQYMDGFVEYLGKRAKSKIEETTSPEGNILLKTRLANIDRYKDLKIGDPITVGGREAEVVGWDKDGKPRVKAK